MREKAKVGASRTSDYLSIERLILDFGYLFDRGDFDGAAAVIDSGSMRYLAGAEVIGEVSTKEDIRRLIGSATIHDDGTPGTHHVITNIRIDIDESSSTASASSYVTILQVSDDSALRLKAAGSYHDRFAIGAEGWHFVERVAKLRDATGHAIAPKVFGD